MHPEDQGIRRPPAPVAPALDEWIAGLPPALLDFTAREVFDLAKAERAQGGPIPTLRAALVEASGARQRGGELLIARLAELQRAWAEASRLLLQRGDGDLEELVEGLREEEAHAREEWRQDRRHRWKSGRRAVVEAGLREARDVLAELRRLDLRHAMIGSYRHAGAILTRLHPPTPALLALVEALATLNEAVGPLRRSIFVEEAALFDESVTVLRRSAEAAKEALGVWCAERTTAA